MKKFYIRHKISPGEIHNVSDKESHIVIENKSIKLDEVVLTIAQNGTFFSRIIFIDKASVEFEVIEKKETLEKVSRIVLLQAILKQKRMDYAIEKASEIGFNEISPVISHYTDLSLKRISKMRNHWDKIANESKRQSLRDDKIIVSKPYKLEDFPLKDYKDSLKICLSTENVDRLSLNDLFYSKKPSKATNFLIAVGPEKGWHTDDLKYFRENNFNMVSLGENILRSETAGLVIGSVLKYYQGQL